MTKKKRNHPDAEELLARPWCYYCERDFDDLKILINHQKAKHFKCERCGRRLNTAGGLSVHMSQVHKENLSAVDNALPNRAGLDIEIFGMEGIPEDIVNQHTQRVLQTFHQAEAERRAASGNQGPGGAGPGQIKKPKFESPADLKKRLAEHRARTAEQANEGSSGGGTPVGAEQAPTPTATQAHAQAQNHFPQSSPQQYGSPHFPPNQPTYSAPPPQLPFGGPNAQLSHGGPAPQQQYNAPPTQQYPGQAPYSQQPQFSHPSAPAPYQQQPMPYPSQPTFTTPPYQSQSPYPPQQYSPAQPFSPMTQVGPPQFAGPPRTFGAGSPVQQFQQQNQMPPRTHTPPQNGLPPRSASGSLPPAPGLPQRPAFQAPPVNAFQFQQMHQGQLHASHNAPPGQQSFAQQNTHQNGQQQPSHTMTQQQDADNSSLDDLISEVKQAEAVLPKQPVQSTEAPKAPLEPATDPTKEEAPKEEKDGKKDKLKVAKLVYSDNEVSPEEKMAMMSRYAYTPDKHAIRV